MDKEELALFIDNRGHDGVISSLLSYIEPGQVLFSLVPLSSWIIGTLMGNKTIASDLLPLTSDFWHICKVIQGFSILLEDFITKEKSKVMDLVLCRLRDVMLCPEVVFQVITYMGLELIPQCCCIGRSAEEEDGHKEAVQLTTSLNSRCFLKALPPLRIILQKAPCQASCLESRVFNAFKAPKLFKRPGALDYHDQQVHIKALSSIRSNKMESPNGSASLTWLPFLCLLHPNIVLWEIDVEVFMGRDICGIGLKVGHKLGLGPVSSNHDILREGFIIKEHQLLIWQVDREVNHCWLLMVDLMSHESPDSLIGTYIASIQVLLDLISYLSKLHSSAVMALVDILVDVLDPTYAKSQLHINVTFHAEEEEGHIGDHPLVVNLNTMYSMFSSIIPAMVMRVAICIQCSGSLEWLWEDFGAFFIDHAGSIEMSWSTGPMGHILFY
jgi:hypothetical protein